MAHDPMKELFVLLQLTQQLADAEALEDALHAVTDAALEILPGDHASIRLLDASHQQLLVSVRSGIGKDSPSLPLRAGEGISGWVLEHGRPARVVDVREDPRFVPPPGSGQGFAIASMVVEPLLSGGRAIGVLSVSSSEKDAFSETDELLARLLANCSVPPIERARLARLAVTDDLTLAFNGRYLATRLLEEMERSRRAGDTFSVLLMDLDHFKQVNDAHGHAVGDRVLRAFADRVRAESRRVDILVRCGGEEFLLVMPATGEEQARLVAERIRQHAAAEPIVIDDAALRQTVSIGVATWDGREDAEAIRRRADRAMYQAKARGRDRVVLAPRS